LEGATQGNDKKTQFQNNYNPSLASCQTTKTFLALPAIFPLSRHISIGHQRWELSAALKAPPTKTYLPTTILRHHVNKMSRRALNRVLVFPSSQHDDESHLLSDLSTAQKHPLLGPTGRQPSRPMLTNCTNVHPTDGQRAKKSFFVTPAIFPLSRHISIGHQRSDLSASLKAPPTNTYLPTTILHHHVNKMSRRALNRVLAFPSSQHDDESHRLSDLSTAPKHPLLGPTGRQPSRPVLTNCTNVHPTEGQWAKKPFGTPAIFPLSRHISIGHQRSDHSASLKAPPTKTYLPTTILHHHVNKMSRRALNRVLAFPSSQHDDRSHRLSDLSTAPKHPLLGPTGR